MKGWPDYTRVTGLVENYDEFAQNYPVGIGDGAARIGSIKTYDMRGRVWWMDDFEAAVLKWHTGNVGTGGSQGLSTAQARNGNQSVQLVTNKGTPRQSEIWRPFPRPRETTIGLEVSLAMEEDFGELIVQLDVYDGINQNRTMLRFLEATKRVYYWNAGGTWTDTGFTWCKISDTGLFNTVKLVMDYKTDEYVRLLYDYQELDLTGTPARVIPWVTSPYMYVGIDAYGDNLYNAPVYVDDVILTIMEPK